jgi:hypothetical protein
MPVRTDIPGAIVYMYEPAAPPAPPICRTCCTRTSGWVYVDPDYYHLPCGHGAPPRSGEKSLDPAVHALALLIVEDA